MMKPRSVLVVILVLVGLVASTASAEKITIAAAADLKFAMDEIVGGFNRNHSGDEVQVVYGSSGKFHTQIMQGAPYDLYFSADSAYPRELVRQGQAASEVKPYAVGRIVLWSAEMDASKMSLASLADPRITKIAIANPKHAPYGKRAEEALRSAGLWEKLQAKLVFGENISQTAQFVRTGNAQVGIIALSLVLNPELAKKGGYYLIPEAMHTPLEQGYIITKQGANKPLTKKFADFMVSKQVRGIMTKYGFVPPDAKGGI
ncbi:MAG: molybdate ABC transporter substrate-binding protein [Geobacter sp.]|nr:molybdate ABC transporter substrate-binding protein [Geobacter sp.]